MKYALMLVLCFGGLMISFSKAQNSSDTEYLKALTTIYAVSKIGGFVKDWCDARAPQTKALTTQGLAVWRKAFRLDDVETRFVALVGDKLAQIDSSLEQQRTKTYQSLDQSSQNPAADCQQIETYLKTNVNPQKLYANEYELVFSQSAPITSNPVKPTPATTGTLYTMAQLGVLLENARKTKQSDETTLRNLGRFFVSGTLEKYDPNDKDAVVFLNTVRNGFRGRISGTCYDLGFNKLYNAGTRNITFKVKFHDMTGSSIIEFEDCEVITNTSGLQAVKLDEKTALERIEVKPNQVMTKPNQGLKGSQLEGIYWNAKGEWRYSGYTFAEYTYLLLKNGWLYDNLRFTPADLNLALSRKLEPQHWGTWKRQDKKIMVQWRDDWGQPKGKAEVLNAEYKAPLKTGSRLNGVFQNSSSYTLGTLRDGTTSTSTDSYTFLPNGTFKFVGFNTTTASSSVDTNVTGQVGNTSLGPNGIVSSNVGGSDDAGTYNFDGGYTLEMKSKTGRVTRAYAFLWDTQKYKNHLVINGTTYSIPDKK